MRREKTDAKIEITEDLKKEEYIEETGTNKNFPFIFLFFPVTFLYAAGITIFFKFPIEEIIADIIMLFIFGGMCQFLIISDTKTGRLREKLSGSLFRFGTTYFIILFLTFPISFLPINGWPFPIIFVALALFSDNMLGIATGTLLLLITSFWAVDANLVYFLVVFGTGVFAVAVFDFLDEDKRFAWPVVMTLAIFFGGLITTSILEHSDRITIDLFLIPLANVFVNFIGLFFILNYYTTHISKKTEYKINSINDQTYPLLVRLKEEIPKEYYHAIHTTFFCDRITKRIGADVDKCHSGGYYHRIAVLEGEINWENTKKICEKHKFPDTAMDILEEYLTCRNNLRSKEACILYLSDTIVTAIMHLHAEKPDMKLDYENIVTRLINKRLSAPNMADTDLSIHDMRVIKEVFQAERLYYEIMK